MLGKMIRTGHCALPALLRLLVATLLLGAWPCLCSSFQGPSVFRDIWFIHEPEDTYVGAYFFVVVGGPPRSRENVSLVLESVYGKGGLYTPDDGTGGVHFFPAINLMQNEASAGRVGNGTAPCLSKQLDGGFPRSFATFYVTVDSMGLYRLHLLRSGEEAHVFGLQMAMNSVDNVTFVAESRRFRVLPEQQCNGALWNSTVSCAGCVHVLGFKCAYCDTLQACVTSDGVGPTDKDACPTYHVQQCYVPGSRIIVVVPMVVGGLLLLLLVSSCCCCKWRIHRKYARIRQQINTPTASRPHSLRASPVMQTYGTMSMGEAGPSGV